MLFSTCFHFFKVLAADRQCRQQLKTLYNPGLLEMIWELVAKKLADILSFRHSFTLSIRDTLELATLR